jgi:phenylpropionate dioxygenase-like ring-hydroxylating dioxygenase large terminal subunit
MNSQDLVIEGPNSFTVSPACYREPELFKQELDQVFHRSWIFLCHDSEIANSGDFKSTRIGKQPVFVVRESSAAVKAFLNICPHRGTTLCREERGNVRAFICPYHAWTFDLSGTLTGVFDAERYPDNFVAEGPGLFPVPRVTNYHGLIFGSMDPDIVDLDTYLGEARKHLDYWLGRRADGKYVAGKPHRYAYQGNWKLQAENVLDGYHANRVHGSAYRTIRQFPSRFPNSDKSRAITGIRRKGQTTGYAGGHGTVEAGAALETGNASPEARQRYFDHLVALNGPDEAQHIVNNRHLLIFPSVVLMDNNIRVIQPISHDYTEVYSYPMFIDGVDEEINFARLSDVQSRVGTAGIISVDDIEIFGRNQTAMECLGDARLHLLRGLGKSVHPYTKRPACWTNGSLTIGSSCLPMMESTGFPLIRRAILGKYHRSSMTTRSVCRSGSSS